MRFLCPAPLILHDVPILCVISGFFRGVKEIAFFWDFTQRRFVVCYRRFGTTYRPNLQSRISPSFGLLDSALFFYLLLFV